MLCEIISKFAFYSIYMTMKEDLNRLKIVLAERKKTNRTSFIVQEFFNTYIVLFLELTWQ